MLSLPLIVFSHANSFPAGSYRVLFEAWRTAGYEVQALERFGHDPRYPVRSNWPHQRAELEHFVEACSKGRKAHLVGHSLGGFLSLMLASHRPDLSASLVMLDSPVVTGWKAQAVRVAKAGRFISHFTPGRFSRRRREEWASRQAALEHFSAKPAFARFAPEVLADYVNAGLEEHASGARLRFAREVETALYDTVPHHLPAMLRRHPPRCPVTYIGGTHSQEGRLVGMGGTRRLARERILWVEGSHLFPFERPQQTAALVLQAIGGASPAG